MNGPGLSTMRIDSLFAQIIDKAPLLAQKTSNLWYQLASTVFGIRS